MRCFRVLPLLAALLACSDQFAQTRRLPDEARKPTFAVDPIRQYYADGKNDDLATAGLGLGGLRGQAPSYANPDAPTAAELRRRAYYENYRSLLALSETDGYGRLYGAQHNRSVAGREYVMPVRYNDHTIASVLMVQVPDTFDSHQPCLVVAATSGSRGIYGAVGVVGNWALHQGCAVATTDKGTGTGFHWLDARQGQAIDGTLVSDADENIHFTAPAGEARHVWQQSMPFRVATKHAHSGKHIEQDWGKFALQAAQFGFYVLNQYHRKPAPSESFYTRANTLVIGAGISNGGAALLRAAEQDSQGWLDGLAVSEPNVFLPAHFQYQINGATQRAQPLPHIATQMALYGPCASLADGLPSPLASYQLPLFQKHFASRCRQLKNAAMLTANDPAEQAAQALGHLTDQGINPAALPLLTTAAAIHLWEAYSVNYLNSYLAGLVEDHLCNVSYAYTDNRGQVIGTPIAVKAGLFANGSGVPPAGGVQLINDGSAAGPRSLYFSADAQGQLDLGFEAMRCFDRLAHSAAMTQQIDKLAFSGDLRGKPTLIVQGAGDNLIQVNHHGRAYTTLNQRREGRASQLRYIEVSHGQHFDALLNYPPLRAHYVPLHYYYEQALTMLLAHLREQQPLPPSQYVQATPPQNTAAPLASLPAIALNAGTLTADGDNRIIAVSTAGIEIP